MKKWICPAAIVLLTLALVTVLLRFLVQGDTLPTSDSRVAIVVDPGERDLVLAEMRGFLAGVQEMSVALTEKDMDAVARTAAGLGMQSAQEVSPALIGKLPLGFKQLGFGVHRSFDRIAENARKVRDPAQTSRELSDTLGRCVACHAQYRLTAGPVTN